MSEDQKIPWTGVEPHLYGMVVAILSHFEDKGIPAPYLHPLQSGGVAFAWSYVQKSLKIQVYATHAFFHCEREGNLRGIRVSLENPSKGISRLIKLVSDTLA